MKARSDAQPTVGAGPDGPGAACDSALWQRQIQKKLWQLYVCLGNPPCREGQVEPLTVLAQGLSRLKEHMLRARKSQGLEEEAVEQNRPSRHGGEKHQRSAQINWLDGGSHAVVPSLLRSCGEWHQQTVRGQSDDCGLRSGAFPMLRYAAGCRTRTSDQESGSSDQHTVEK